MALFPIHRQYLTDENRKPIAVVIPIEEYERLLEIVEDQELLGLMNEVKDDPLMSFEEGWKYYDSLPKAEDAFEKK
jgi:hypothetical protein